MPTAIGRTLTGLGLPLWPLASTRKARLQVVDDDCMEKDCRRTIRRVSLQALRSVVTRMQPCNDSIEPLSIVSVDGLRRQKTDCRAQRYDGFISFALIPEPETVNPGSAG